MFPLPASPLLRIIAAPSAIRRSASPKSRAPHTNGVVNACLSTWYLSSAGVSTSRFVDVVDPHLLQDLRLGEMTDAHLGHHRDRDRIHDAPDQLEVAHARHAPIARCRLECARAP